MPAIPPSADAALQPACLDLEMAVCLKDGAWIVEAQGFFMRHRFGLRHELMTRVNAFHLLLVTELSGGYVLPYDAVQPSRKLRRDDFSSSRRFSATVTQAAAGKGYIKMIRAGSSRPRKRTFPPSFRFIFSMIVRLKTHVLKSIHQLRDLVEIGFNPNGSSSGENPPDQSPRRFIQ